ncbi:MAG TPA: hypothetical protein VMU18_00950 [Rhodoblastus sp.]|nr:hypothetical protein [Rhodoblastus sp.]
MRLARKFALAGVTTLALSTGAGLALAQSFHTMTVQTPEGGLARIDYVGKVPPRIAFAPVALTAADSIAVAPFVLLDRISAQMDRDMFAFMNDVAMAPMVTPDQLFEIGMRDAPAGVVQFSTVSTLASNGHYCSRLMEVTRPGPGAPPHVVTHMFGDCRGVGARWSDDEAAVPHHRAPPSIETKTWPGGPNHGPELLDVAYQPER